MGRIRRIMSAQSTWTCSLATVEDDSVAAGLEAVLTEAARLEQFGVTEAELARAKEETLSFYESIYDERNNVESSSHADEYLAHFLNAVTSAWHRV